MIDNNILITVASWEERFQLGYERLIEESTPEKTVVYYLKEYAHRTEENRLRVKELSESKGIELVEHELTFDDPAQSWTVLFDTLKALEIDGKQITVDITTMPRETIWTVLDLLEGARDSILNFAYHKPGHYSEEWLSRDPARPRMVYKLSGIARLGAPTRLLILAGFDLDRIRQMIEFFEPELSLLGIQAGDQFDNRRFIEKHKEEFGHRPGTSIFEIDAYSEDQGFQIIEEHIRPHLQDSNMVMSSLGPKPSAIALFRIHKLHSGTGLVYAPSREFNPDYSSGIGETLVGKVSIDSHSEE